MATEGEGEGEAAGDGYGGICVTFVDVADGESGTATVVDSFVFVDPVVGVATVGEAGAPNSGREVVEANGDCGVEVGAVVAAAGVTAATVGAFFSLGGTIACLRIPAIRCLNCSSVMRPLDKLIGAEVADAAALDEELD